MTLFVWHYDGVSGVRYDTELVPVEHGFQLRTDAGVGVVHAWTDLLPRGVKNGDLVYGLKNRRGWQIGFAQPVPDTIAKLITPPAKYGHVIDRFGFLPAAGAFAAVSAVALFIGIKAPDWVAPFVPQSWEKKLGDAMVGDFGGRFCNGPGSRAALNALSNRLDPSGPPIEIQIANISMVNAVALPGGKIVIFRGLLQESKSPDELAGVLGHEMGHVRNRDVMQALLRQTGLSVLMGGFNSDATGYVNAMISATYSRDAESKADTHAIGLMKQAKISPIDTAGFFERIGKDEKKLGKASAALGYLSSHPLSESREKSFRNSVVKGTTYTAAITPDQWSAILDSCHDDPNVAKDDGFMF